MTVEWRVWLVRHSRGVQIAAVLLALALTVVVTIRIDRNLHPAPDVVADSTAPDSNHKNPFAFLDDASKPKYWETKGGPDKSMFLLVTKCVSGSVYFQFDVLTTPTMFAKYERTYGKAPRFELALLDSSGFKTGRIPINHDDLIANTDSTGKVAMLSAKDAIQLSCSEYKKLKTWEPAWILAR
jgi:hypothetical protein